MLCSVLYPHPEIRRGQGALGRRLHREPQQRRLVGLWAESAGTKQKGWAHLERELKALTTSRFPENREVAHRVFPIIYTARQAHRDYHQGRLLQALRPIVEAELADVLEHPMKGRWAADAQALATRFRKHWSDWFTVLCQPEVAPDNNDAERGLWPVVIHRKVTGGTRSDWGAQLVAMMFSFLESMRRQGENACRPPLCAHRLVGVLSPHFVTRISL